MRYAVTVTASWVFHVEADSLQEARLMADQELDDEMDQAKPGWEITDVSED